MVDLSSILNDGQRFVFDELGLGDEQLRLIGKLALLKTDGEVDFMKYTPERCVFYVKFKKALTALDFEKVLEKYEIPGEYSRKGPEAILSQRGTASVEVLF